MKKTSGRFLLRIDPKLHGELAKEARSRDISLNRLINEKLINGPQKGIIDERLLLRIYGEDLLGVVLFGSYAQGRARKTSDIDLLLILDSSVPIHRGLYLEWDKKIRPKLTGDFSPHFVSCPEDFNQLGSIWLESALDGQVLIDKSQKTAQILAIIRDRIAQGFFQRRWSHGHPYWIRRSGDKNAE